MREGKKKERMPKRKRENKKKSLEIVKLKNKEKRD